MRWPEINNAAAILALALHLTWILWVIFGAFWTSGRRWLTAFHIVSLVWGIMVEVGPWPCPLSMAEDFFQRSAGVAPSPDGFLEHCIGSIVYPNVSVRLLTICGVAVCVANLAIYTWRVFRWIRRSRRAA